MNDVKYSTTNEKNLICSIQRQLGALDNGYIGTDTLVSIAKWLGANCWPLTVKMYNCPTIVSTDILAWSPKAPLKNFTNSMLGSFTYPRATTPCSILVSSGQTLCAYSCHSSINGKPESVIYKTNKGEIKMARVRYTSELPKDIKWAVGGMGLVDNYNPSAEGFTGAYADVVRKTNHNVLGYKNGLLYGVYCPNMSGADINKLCKDKFKFEGAILLDGGGLAAINGTETFAKINTSTKQGYAIQFI